MKMKKILSMVLAGTMVLSLAACGGGSGSGSDATKAADATQAADATEAAGGEASSDAVWKIGGIGPITGGGAAYGISVMNASQLAAEEINAAGGINGYKVEYQFQDDELNNEKSVNAYNSLKDWGMQILLGTVTSGCGIAVGAETVSDNMFMLTPSGSSQDVADTGDNIFQVCFTDPNQGAKSAQYIGENGLGDKVAIIYDSSDPYSTGIYDTFKAEAANQPFEIVAEGAFTADNKTDFSVQLQQANDAGANLVFLPIYYTEAAMILTQSASKGYSFNFFGCDGMDGILTVEDFDTKLAEGLMLLTPFVPTSEAEATKTFVDNYRAKFDNLDPNQFGADAYDGMYALKAALEAADLTPEASVSDICDALKTQFTSLNFVGITSDESGMTWTAEGYVDKAPKAAKIENGQYVMME